MKTYLSAKKKLNNYFLVMDDVKRSDYMLLGGILLICCLFFCQKYDLSITIKHSITMIEGFLKGRPQHFYGDVYQNAVSGYYLGEASAVNAANYSYLLYFALAIINLPLFLIEKLFRFSIPMYLYIQWAKIFIVLVILGTGYIMKQIGLKLNMSHQRSNWLAFAFISSPILLFGSTTFGQIDIFSIFFLCLAMLKYFEKDYYKFCAFMAIAIELKLFAILAFVVLIFLIEKRLLQIIKYLLCGLSLYLIETFIFSFSGGKKLTSIIMAATYNFKGRIFNSGIYVFHFVSFIMLGFIIILVLAYKKEIKTDDEHKAYGILFPLAMYTVLLGFIDWHPQWVCIIVPFVVLATFSFPNYRLSMYIEIALGAGYIIMSTIWYTNNVDADMINQGLLPVLTNFTLPASDPPFQYRLFVVMCGLPVSFYASIFFGALVMNLFTKIPFHQDKLVLADDISDPVSRSFIWTRMLTIFLFIVPTFAYYFYQWFKIL